MAESPQDGPELEVGQIWRSSLTSKEILDFGTQMGSGMVHYREGSDAFWNTLAEFHIWIRRARATLQSKGFQSDGGWPGVSLPKSPD
jgi:hypothetical protein